MKLAISASCLVIVGGDLFGQQIWKVHCAGAHGAQFTDLPQAVAAANPGDEILVYYDSVVSCTGTPYTATVITKPLRIAGFYVGPSSVPIGAGAVNLLGPLVILGIPAGERVEISGLHVNATAFGAVGGVVGLDCAGDLLLENCGVTSGGYPTTYVHFERCNNVVLRGCDFTLGGYPLTVVDSNLLMTTTLVTHTFPSPVGPPWAFATTAHGVRVVNSNITAIGSLVNGANEPPSVPNGFYPSRPAVRVESGTFRVGPATTIRGGTSPSSPPPHNHHYGFEVVDPTIGSVHQDARGTIVNPPLTPTVVGEWMHATYHSWVIANQVFGVRLYGPANGFALLCFGDWLPNTPSPFGPLAIDPGTVLPIELVALPPPDGYHEWFLSCPLTAPVAHGFALQALTIAPNGALGVTVPSPLMVSWPANVIP